MKIKIFTTDNNGKISITKYELEELLNEAYEEGRKDGNHSNITTINPYYTWSTTTGGSTISLCSDAIDKYTINGDAISNGTITTNASKVIKSNTKPL